MEYLPPERLREIADKLIEYHRQADETNEWTFFVDEIYAQDCIYICEYGGTMNVTANGIDEIKATHYGRDMQKGWEEWTFPYMGVYVGENNKLVTHWMNRGPGKRADGRFFETPGISFITVNQEGKICSQLDMFDMAHQMKLCDDLEAAGLLSPDLKKNWVIPMKQKLLDMLNLTAPAG